MSVTLKHKKKKYKELGNDSLKIKFTSRKYELHKILRLIQQQKLKYTEFQNLM